MWRRYDRVKTGAATASSRPSPASAEASGSPNLSRASENSTAEAVPGPEFHASAMTKMREFMKQGRRSAVHGFVAIRWSAIRRAHGSICTSSDRRAMCLRSSARCACYLGNRAFALEDATNHWTPPKHLMVRIGTPFEPPSGLETWDT